MAEETKSVRVERTVTIDRSPEELYNAWRRLEDLPQIMQGLESVEEIDSRRSRWTAKLPVVGVSTWEAEIIRDEPSHEIAWRTVGNADLAHEGAVKFQPSRTGHGSEVTLEMTVHMAGGEITQALAKLVGKSPEDYVSRNLRNFKQLMETGAVASNKGSGRRR